MQFRLKFIRSFLFKGIFSWIGLLDPKTLSRLSYWTRTIPRRRVPNPPPPNWGGDYAIRSQIAGDYAKIWGWTSKNGLENGKFEAKTQIFSGITQKNAKIWGWTSKNGLENGNFGEKTRFFSPAAPIGTAGGSIIINLVYFLIFFSILRLI